MILERQHTPICDKIAYLGDNYKDASAATINRAYYTKLREAAAQIVKSVMGYK